VNTESRRPVTKKRRWFREEGAPHSFRYSLPVQRRHRGRVSVFSSRTRTVPQPRQMYLPAPGLSPALYCGGVIFYSHRVFFGTVPARETVTDVSVVSLSLSPSEVAGGDRLELRIDEVGATAHRSG